MTEGKADKLLFKTVNRALSEHFPNAPAKHRKIIAFNVMRKSRRGDRSLVKINSTDVHNHTRHRLTEYDKLMKINQLTREEARLIVKPELDDIFVQWSRQEDAEATFQEMVNEQ